MRRNGWLEYNPSVQRIIIVNILCLIELKNTGEIIFKRRQNYRQPYNPTKPEAFAIDVVWLGYDSVR